MKIKNLNGNGKLFLDTDKVEIYVPHLDEILAFDLHSLYFVYNEMGKGSYKNVMDEISDRGLLRPTTAQNFSLLNVALQNKNEKFCKHILKRFNSQHVWSSTEHLWGKEEVVVYDNVDGKMPPARKSLIELHKRGDKAVRVVPHGFEIYSQTVDEFVNNPYILAQVGDERMKEIVRQVAKGISRYNPMILELELNEPGKKTYTSLDFGKRVVGLTVDYCGEDGDSGGYAFGVRVVEGKAA